MSLLFCKKPEVFGSQIAIVGPRKKEEFWEGKAKLWLLQPAVESCRVEGGKEGGAQALALAELLPIFSTLPVAAASAAAFWVLRQEGGGKGDPTRRGGEDEEVWADWWSGGKEMLTSTETTAAAAAKQHRSEQKVHVAAV